MTRCLLLVWAALLIVQPLHGSDAYWVWERSKSLTASEAAVLKTASVTQLYWQAGTVTTNGTIWKWRERFPLDWKALNPAHSGLLIVPVLRLEPPEGAGLPEGSFPQLITLANNLASESGSQEIQIDYECPDRLIPNYLDFLKHLKESGHPWRLSISALGHWSKYTDQFKGLADEITPMFYDLNPSRETLSAGTLPPLLDAASTASQIAAWKDCPLPWRAGLPNFSRLTLVSPQGVSRGNIRRWTWDELWFSSLLEPLGITANGETCFTVKTPGVLANTHLQPGETIVARYPDRGALPPVLDAIKAAGAEGAIYFRLAGADDMSGFSPLDLHRSTLSPPAFQVTLDASTRITLTNTSSADLMPRNFGTKPDQRGYCLVVHADAAIWQDVMPGDFSSVTKVDEGYPPSPFGATTLRFRFAHLPAGQSLETSLVERGPGPVHITWRIENLDRQNVWHDLNSSPR